MGRPVVEPGTVGAVGAVSGLLAESPGLGVAGVGLVVGSGALPTTVAAAARYVTVRLTAAAIAAAI